MEICLKLEAALTAATAATLATTSSSNSSNMYACEALATAFEIRMPQRHKNSIRIICVFVWQLAALSRSSSNKSSSNSSRSNN